MRRTGFRRQRGTDEGAGGSPVLGTIGALVAAAGVGVGAVGAAPAGAASDPVAVHGPVHDSNQLTPTNDLAAVAVHGVRRIEGGTVLYLSVGYPSTIADAPPAMGLDERTTYRTTHGEAYAGSLLVDPVGRKAYAGVVTPDGKCVCSASFQAVSSVLGRSHVLYQVLAPLPPEVTTVDVYTVGQVVQGVPVEQGLLTPEVDDLPVVLGTGWPRVDAAEVTTATTPGPDTSGPGVLEVTYSESNLEQTVTKSRQADKVSVSLASDVLFAVDQATLTSRARAVIQEAAREIADSGATGRLDVVGHTDSDGSDRHNLDLSRRRAAAVAVALEPLLPAGITLQVSGRGEEDPVASNDTDAGKALNRRVTVELNTGEGST